jgi:hypothetical protein
MQQITGHEVDLQQLLKMSTYLIWRTLAQEVH